MPPHLNRPITDTHLLLELVLAVVDYDGVVVAVEPVDERLDGGLVQVANVGGCLPGLLVQEHQLRVDSPEGINHHLALHRLDGVDHHGHRALVQLLEALAFCVSGMGWW